MGVKEAKVSSAGDRTERFDGAERVLCLVRGRFATWTHTGVGATGLIGLLVNRERTRDASSGA